MVAWGQIAVTPAPAPLRRPAARLPRTPAPHTGRGPPAARTRRVRPGDRAADRARRPPVEGPRLDLWRAPTDNDRGSDDAGGARQWRAAGPAPAAAPRRRAWRWRATRWSCAPGSRRPPRVRHARRLPLDRRRRPAAAARRREPDGELAVHAAPARPAAGRARHARRRRVVRRRPRRGVRGQPAGGADRPVHAPPWTSCRRRTSSRRRTATAPTSAGCGSRRPDGSRACGSRASRCSASPPGAGRPRIWTRPAHGRPAARRARLAQPRPRPARPRLRLVRARRAAAVPAARAEGELHAHLHTARLTPRRRPDLAQLGPVLP